MAASQVFTVQAILSLLTAAGGAIGGVYYGLKWNRGEKSAEAKGNLWKECVGGVTCIAGIGGVVASLLSPDKPSHQVKLRVVDHQERRISDYRLYQLFRGATKTERHLNQEETKPSCDCETYAIQADSRKFQIQARGYVPLEFTFQEGDHAIHEYRLKPTTPGLPAPKANTPVEALRATLVEDISIKASRRDGSLTVSALSVRVDIDAQGCAAGGSLNFAYDWREGATKYHGAFEFSAEPGKAENLLVYYKPRDAAD